MGRSNKGIARLFLLLGAGSVLIYAITSYAVSVWLDKQPDLKVVESRLLVRSIGHSYGFISKIYTPEDRVRRAYKLAQLVALSQYGRKKNADFIDDLSLSKSLLSPSIAHEINDEALAIAELNIERLTLSNRIHAFSARLGLNGVNAEDLKAAIESAKTPLDSDTQRVLIREISVAQILHRSPSVIPLVFEEGDSASKVLYDRLVVGLARCSMGLDASVGSREISDFFKPRNSELIFQTTRNLDAPLIASAMKGNQECKELADSILLLIGG